MYVYSILPLPKLWVFFETPTHTPNLQRNYPDVPTTTLHYYRMLTYTIPTNICTCTCTCMYVSMYIPFRAPPQTQVGEERTVNHLEDLEMQITLLTSDC